MAKAVASRTDPPDGRAARSKRTQDLLVSALYDLIREGDPNPSAAAVAHRAGVSLRSVYVHFANREVLHRAMAERAAARVIARLTPIDRGQPLAVRIEEFCTHRERANEELAPLRRAAAQHPLSPALSDARDYGRRAGREQISRVFGEELAAFDPAARRRRIALLDAASNAEAWDLLRLVHGLSVADTRAAIAEGVAALLDSGPAGHQRP